MKTKVLLLSSLLVLTSVFSVGCSKNNKTNETNIVPVDADKLYAEAPENTIYLNLTANGLYNGEHGTLLTNSNVEYGVTLTDLKVGDALPSKEITSTVHNVSFLTWCFYAGDGMLTYTASVVENVSLYHAVFKYTGTYDGNYYYNSSEVTSAEGSSETTSETTSMATSEETTSETTSSEESNVVRYYFVDQSWWNKLAAASSIYLYRGEVNNNTWPGEKMTWVSYDSEKGCNTWYADVDLDVYSYALICRVSNDGTSDLGAKTKTITLTKEFNTIYLDSTEAWVSDSNEASFTTALVNY